MKNIQIIKKLSTILLFLATTPFAYGMDRLSSVPSAQNALTAENVGNFIAEQRRNPESFFSCLPKDVTDRVTDHIEAEQFMREDGHKSSQGQLFALCWRRNTRYNHLLCNDLITSLITAGADVNHQNKNGETALIWAAHNGNAVIVDRLIAAKANVNFQNKYGDTALIWAARYGDAAIVDRLIAAKADVNLQNKVSGTALIWAAHNGNAVIVDRLIAAGANVNHQSDTGNTALIYAAEKGHAAIVDRLITAGANVNHQCGCGCGNTALFSTIWCGHTPIVDRLIFAKANVNHQNKDGETTLMRAADRGHTDIVDRLIAAKANVNHQDKYGDTALMIAARNGHIAIVDRLIAAGATFNPNMYSIVTQLHKSLRSSQFTQALIRNGSRNPIIHAIGLIQRNPRASASLFAASLAGMAGYMAYKWFKK